MYTHDSGSFDVRGCSFVDNECGAAAEGAAIDFDSSGFPDTASRPRFGERNRFVARGRGASIVRYVGLADWEYAAGQYAPRTGTLTESFVGCPFRCSAGTYAAGTSSASPCLDCSAGTYQNVPGAASCKACPLGSYCPARSVQPRPCMEGTYGDRQNLTLQDECTDVEEGFWAPSGKSAPIACDSSVLRCPGRLKDTRFHGGQVCERDSNPSSACCLCR